MDYQRLPLRCCSCACTIRPNPAKVLRDYLAGMSVTDAAKHLGVTRAALSRILNSGAGISADMALRLSEAFGTSAELWIAMQAQYDL